MAKFYVQSGTIRGIVDCYDSECAAVWIVNRVMTEFETGDIGSSNLVESSNDGMFALGDDIRISEIGFDRDDCEVHDTHSAFVQWHQLMRAIDVLHEKLDDNFDQYV